MAYGNGLLKMNKGEEAYSTFGVMKKAAILIKDVNKGNKFNFDDIVFKRTSQKSDISQLQILNFNQKIYNRDIKKGSTLNNSYFK